MSPSTAVAASAGDVTRARAALDQLLDQFVDVLMRVDTPTYCDRPVPGVSGSIGGHVRHALDHVAALLSGRPSGTLSYDHRERGTAVERDPSAALRQILRLKAALERAAAVRPAEEPLFVETQMTRSGAVSCAWSTFSRELAFVVSHTIHHQAMVALLLIAQGVDVPEGFGYAPSTPLPR